MFITILKFILVFTFGMGFAIASLLVSRSTICDDIREKRGKHSLRNHPKFKDGVWKWFFLTERTKHMVFYRYVLFIIETILSIFVVLIMAFIIAFGDTDFLGIVLGCVALSAVIVKGMISMFPWGRYRN